MGSLTTPKPSAKHHILGKSTSLKLFPMIIFDLSYTVRFG
jgi:hypothetical protein